MVEADVVAEHRNERDHADSHELGAGTKAADVVDEAECRDQQRPDENPEVGAFADG